MKKVRILTFYFFTAFFGGCLDDTFSPGEYSVSYSADLVAYFETHGDFINSADNPAFISADELFNNISNCLILDVRSNDEFQSGHISGAVNVNLNELIGELDNQSLQQFEKIVIVSRTGQKSAYAASLLRLYGINNVYSLKYGMTVWNKDFLRYWSSAKGDSKYLSQYKQAHFTKPRLGTELPVIDLENDDLAMDEMVRLRITELLNENSYKNSTAVIDELDSKYKIINRAFENSFIICYGDNKLYREIVFINKESLPEPTIFGGHPMTAVRYDPYNDFKSSEFLLTLPVDKTIYIYSYTGQMSSFITSYLKILGYDVKSILFGAVSMFNEYIELNRIEEVLTEKDIREYPYVK